jgi:hypothetical protein
MKRFAVVTGVFLAFGLIMIFAESCGNREQILDPTEHQQQSFLTTSVGSEHELLEEGSLLVFIPKTGDAREIYDPWISDAVLSMLPDATWGLLVTKGAVHVDDVEIAGMIVAIAGMETFDVSDGILLASWGCIKSGHGGQPTCTPWPACCDGKDKDMYFQHEF